MSEEMGTISIPERLIRAIEERLPLTDFASADEYAAFVIGEVLAGLSEDESTVPDQEFSAEDEEKVKARLRALGYLD
jgi:division protein CdvB (Snf7/Vps24/ESCRT-III family)